MTAIAWGTGFIAQKIGLDTLTPLAFNGVRYLMAMFFLVPLLLFDVKKTGYFDIDKNSAESIAYRKRNAIVGGFWSGIFMAISVNLQQLGLVTISVSKSGFITALYIAFVPIIGIFIGKKLLVRVYISCAVALTGFMLLSGQEGFGQFSIGDIYTLLSAIFFAVQIWVVSAFVNKDNDIILSVLTLGIAGLVTMIVSLIFEPVTWEAIVNTLPALLFSAIVPTSIGYTLQIVGQKYTDSTTAAFLMSLESVFAAIFGALILKEALSLREIIGCALIFGANMLIQFKREKPEYKTK